MNRKHFFQKILFYVILVLSIFSCSKKKETPNDSKYNAQQVAKFYQLANKYYDTNKFDSAFYYGNKIRLHINPELDLKKYATTMFIIITSQQMRGDYSGAENSIVETISAIENLNNQKYIYKFYSMLANNYAFLKDYENAINYHKKASKYKTNKKYRVLNKLNIGHIYKEKKQYQKSIEILLPLLNEKELQKNKYYKSGVLNDLGYCYFKLGNPNAINYLNKSLELNSNLDTTADNDYDLTANYYNLHEYYLERDKKKLFIMPNYYIKKRQNIKILMTV